MTIRQMITHASPIFLFRRFRILLYYLCPSEFIINFSSKNNFNLLNNEKYHTLFTYIVVF